MDSQMSHDNYGPKGQGSPILRAASNHQVLGGFVRALYKAAAAQGMDIDEKGGRFEFPEGPCMAFRVQLGQGLLFMVEYVKRDGVIAAYERGKATELPHQQIDMGMAEVGRLTELLIEWMADGIRRAKPLEAKWLELCKEDK